MNFRFLLIFLALSISIFSFENLNGANPLKEYLLPRNHPLHRELDKLFKRNVTLNTDNQSGFYIFLEKRKLMIIEHPKLKGYLIKKLKDSIPMEKQLNNYIKRIEGAQAVAKFIKKNKLKHIVVPKKWLYKLPQKHSGHSSYILIVEKMDLCSPSEVHEKYNQIDYEMLQELCLVVNTFRGLDSHAGNLPFTRQNKIAFIDTEKWNVKRDEHLDRLRKDLNEENYQAAQEIFAEISLSKLK